MINPGKVITKKSLLKKYTDRYILLGLWHEGRHDEKIHPGEGGAGI